MWDAMEFEDEHCEATSIGLEGRGELDEAQTRSVLQPDQGMNQFFKDTYMFVCLGIFDVFGVGHM